MSLLGSRTEKLALLIGTDKGAAFFTWPEANTSFAITSTLPAFDLSLAALVEPVLSNNETARMPSNEIQRNPADHSEIASLASKLESNAVKAESLESGLAPLENEKYVLPCFTLALKHPYRYATLSPLGQLCVFRIDGSKIEINLSQAGFERSREEAIASKSVFHFLSRVTYNHHENVIIVCCWDGTTFFIGWDELKFDNVLKFCPEPIQCRTQAFVAGAYALEEGKNELILAYQTFENSILLYYNIELPCARKDWQDLVKELPNKEGKHGKNLARMNATQIAALLSADVNLLTQYRDFLKNRIK